MDGRVHVFGRLSTTPKEFFLRRQQASLDLVGQLLGAAGIEEDKIKRAEDSNQLKTKEDYPGGRAKIHNTLHLTSAYIALAAAAHGASIAVECVSDKGSKIFGNEPNSEARKSTFLLRLWLTQPPEDIQGILRHTSHSTTTGSDSSNNIHEAVDEEVTVLGGALEIATWIARKLGFRY
jgi:hypothetical protein